MKKLLVGFLLLVILLVLSLSYIGVFPVLSKYMAKQVDLGVKADPSFVPAFEAKYGTPNGSGKVDLDVSFSSVDATSISSVWESRDKQYPFHNVQIRFNPDGSGEASGFVNISSVISVAKLLGYSDSDIEKGKEYVKYVSGDLPFYVKASGGVANNNWSIEPQSFQLGRVNVPSSISSKVAPVIIDMVERRLTQLGGANIQEAKVVDGALHFAGSLPETIKY